MIDQILSTYAMFFDWDLWVQALTDPASWGIILTLVIMEGLLSADNALVLAVMVKHLPEKQRKRALFYGLLGAYIFRFIAIGIGVYLIKFWYVKLFGALYLAYLSINYFNTKRKAQQAAGLEEEETHGIKQDGILIRMFGTFWGTVAAVELMDIAFSVDSVLAAFGVSEEIWVLLLGGMLGVLMMRGVAGIFIRLIDRIPELETSAYVLILLIAVKMVLSVIGIDVGHYTFFGVLVLVFGITFIIHFRNKKKQAANENN